MIDLVGVLPFALILSSSLRASLDAAPAHVQPLIRLAYVPRLLRSGRRMAAAGALAVGFGLS